MSDYRTPEEQDVSSEDDARIEAALDQAVKDGGAVIVAMGLDEPAEVVEDWIDRVYDNLRANLSDNRPDVVVGGNRIVREDRLRAIVLLLEPRIRAEASALRNSIEVGR